MGCRAEILRSTTPFRQTIGDAYFGSPQLRAQIDDSGRDSVVVRADIADIEDLLMPAFTGALGPRAVSD